MHLLPLSPSLSCCFLRIKFWISQCHGWILLNQLVVVCLITFFGCMLFVFLVFVTRTRELLVRLVWPPWKSYWILVLCLQPWAHQHYKWSKLVEVHWLAEHVFMHIPSSQGFPSPLGFHSTWQAYCSRWMTRLLWIDIVSDPRIEAWFLSTMT